MNPKAILLKPFLLILYKKVLKSECCQAVIEDLHFWSVKTYGEIKPEKQFFLSKMLADPKFRTLFYHRFKCGLLLKKYYLQLICYLLDQTSQRLLLVVYFSFIHGVLELAQED